MSIENDLIDFPRSRGAAAIGARLRRLSERIDRETSELYHAHQVDFQQRWFGTFTQIRLCGPVAVGEIAARLGVTHAAVSQVCSALLAKGLVGASSDPADTRRRLLCLTPTGEELATHMGQFWQQLEAVSCELEAEAGHLLSAIERLETALDRESIAKRFQRIAASVDR